MPRRVTARDLLRAALEGKSALRKARGVNLPGAGLAGGEIIDSLGRRWSSAKHPRDSRGRFIETGGTARVYGVGVAKVIKVKGRQHITVRDRNGVDHDVPAGRVTMMARPDGTNPLGDKRGDRKKVLEEDARREADPQRGDGQEQPDLGDADGDGIPDAQDDDDNGDGQPDEAADEARRRALEEDLAEADAELEQAKLDRDADGVAAARQNIAEARAALDEHRADRQQRAAGTPKAPAGERRPGEWRQGDFAVLTRPDGRMVLTEISGVDPAGRPIKYRLTGERQDKPVAGARLQKVPAENVNGPKLRQAFLDWPQDGLTPDEMRGLVTKHAVKGKPAAARPRPAVPGQQPQRPTPTPGVPAAPAARQPAPVVKPSWSLDDDGLRGELASVESQLNGMADGDINKAPLVRRQRAVKAEMRKRGMADADTPDTPVQQATPAPQQQNTPNVPENAPQAPQQPVAAAPEERADGPDGLGGRWAEVVANADDDQLVEMDRKLAEALPTANREEGSYLPTRILAVQEEMKRRGLKQDGPAAPKDEDSTIAPADDRNPRPHLEPFKTRQGAENAVARDKEWAESGDADLSIEQLDDGRFQVVMRDLPDKADREARREDEADRIAGRTPKDEDRTPTEADPNADRERDRKPAAGADPLAVLAAQRRQDEADAIETRANYERVIDEIIEGLPNETDEEVAKLTGHRSARLVDAARGEQDRRRQAEIAENRTEPAVSPPRETVNTDSTPEQETPDGDSSDVREPSEGVLADVPAEPVRDDRRPGAVLPEPRRAGAGAGDGGGAERPAAVDAGQPSAGRSPAGGDAAGGGDRAGRSGVPAAGAGDRGAADAGDSPARVGGRGDAAGVAPKATTYAPTGQGDLQPKGEKAKLAANIEAIRTLRKIDAEDRPATKAEQSVLARWSGWGALQRVFKDNDDTFAAERADLKSLLSDAEWKAARTNMLNAHYTDAGLVDRVWGALKDLGFAGGRVLEPGSGSGNFIGRAPKGARMTGVELDPITAGISRQLYPDADIHNESFAKSPFNDNVFDAVVGNVPFGNYPLLDKRDNKGKHSIHNHFIIKALRKTKPGGVAAVITSQFTMDNADPKARREIAEMGDLIGALRLPNGAHENAAGTDVVTDVLLFRKRKKGELPGDQSWLQAHPATHPDGRPVVGISVTKDGQKQPPKQLHINDYFRDHPENVLGEIRDGGYNGMAVKRLNDHPRGLDGWMQEALTRLTSAAKADGRGWNPDPDTDGTRALRNMGDAAEGRITFGSEVEIPGKTPRSKPTRALRFQQVQDGRVVDMDVPATQQAEVRDLLDLRDQYRVLQELEAEAPDDDDEALTVARARLRKMHDAYVKTYGGPINRFTESTTKDGKTIRRAPGAVALLMQDADADLFGLDFDFNPETGTFKRADVFEKRQTNLGRKVAETTDSPRDAVALVQEQGLPLTYASIGKVLGLKPETAKTALRGVVFEDHDGSGRLVPRADYLSGNVRQKLAAAREAAASNPALADNVDALEKAMPADAAIQDVPLQLGATWIKPQMVKQFAQSLMGYGNDVEVELDDGKWSVKTPRSKYGRNIELETATWGTQDRSFYKLLEAALRQQHHFITVKKKTEDGDWYVDRKASEAATAKAEEIRDAFVDWAWSNAEVADKLAGEYNQRFRSIVPRNYDDAPMRTLPGMGNVVKALRPHQNAAVTRMVSEPSVLLEHVVGAGKTYTLVAGAMEMKRLGMVNKPVLAIPGHMLGQWTKEIKELYPQARVLAVDSDSLSGAGARRRFAAKVKSSDWDMVVMTRESFESVPVSEESMRAYLGRELEKLEAQKRRAAGDKVREKALQTAIEKAKASIEEQIEKRKDPDGITFEDLGFDYVMADEAHAYKNLNFSTLMQGIASPEGAGRARDMHMKLEVLRDLKKDQANPRIVTFATGTPVSNSLAEMFTMSRFLRPDLLEEAGVDDFDAWAATFATVSSKPEIDTAAGGFVDKTRMRGFTDALGDALRIWRSFSDTKTAKHLNLPRPKLKGGQRQIHVVDPTEAQKQALRSFKHRVDVLPPGRPQKGQDTHVAIIGDGRRAALDPRLMSPRGLEAAGIDRNDPTLDSPKVEAAANKIADIWAEHKDRTYKTKHWGSDDRDSVEDAALPGALQMVFVDSDAPKKDQFSSYQALKDALVARGMDPKGIRFIQEVAGSSAKKAALFEDARQGKVQVLIGSTEAMGTGTNVQNRLAALHHLDGSWKPSDIEQREGRGLRQGNQHDEIEIHAYVTKGTHDQKTWDMVTYKQAALDAISNGSVDMRAVEFADDVDPLTDFDTLVGAAATDPLVMDRREVESALKKLRGAEQAHRRQVANAKSKVAASGRLISESERRADKLTEALGRRVDTAGDAFRMGVKKVDQYGYNTETLRLGSRTEAAEELGKQLETIFGDSYWPGGERAHGLVGEIAGFSILATQVNNQGQQKKIKLELTTGGRYDTPLPLEPVNVSKDDLKTGMAGVITRLENRAAGIETRIAGEKGQADRIRSEMAAAVENSTRTFRKADELKEAERSLALLNQLLTGKAKQDESSEDDEERSATLSEDQIGDLRDEYEQLKGAASRRAADEKARRMAELAAQANRKDEPVAPLLTDDEKETVTAEVANDLAELGITRDLEPESAPEPEAVEETLPEDAPEVAPEPEQVAAEVAQDFAELDMPEEAPVAEVTPDVTPDETSADQVVEDVAPEVEDVAPVAEEVTPEVETPETPDAPVDLTPEETAEIEAVRTPDAPAKTIDDLLTEAAELRADGDDEAADALIAQITPEKVREEGTPVRGEGYLDSLPGAADAPSAEGLDEGPAIDGVIGAPEAGETPVRGADYFDNLPAAEAPSTGSKFKDAAIAEFEASGGRQHDGPIDDGIRSTSYNTYQVTSKGNRVWESTNRAKTEAVRDYLKAQEATPEADAPETTPLTPEQTDAELSPDLPDADAPAAAPELTFRKEDGVVLLGDTAIGKVARLSGYEVQDQWSKWRATAPDGTSASTATRKEAADWLLARHEANKPATDADPGDTETVTSDADASAADTRVDPDMAAAEIADDLAALGLSGDLPPTVPADSLPGVAVETRDLAAGDTITATGSRKGFLAHDVDGQQLSLREPLIPNGSKITSVEPYGGTPYKDGKRVKGVLVGFEDGRFTVIPDGQGVRRMGREDTAPETDTQDAPDAPAADDIAAEIAQDLADLGLDVPDPATPAPAAPEERNPDFGKRIGQPSVVQQGDGSDIWETVGGRTAGQTMDRPLFTIRQGDSGAWDVRRSGVDMPIHSASTKKGAESWALKEATSTDGGQLPRGTAKALGIKDGDRGEMADAVGTVRTGTFNVNRGGVYFTPDEGPNAGQRMFAGGTATKLRARKLDAVPSAPGQSGRTSDGTEYSEGDLVESLLGRRLTDDERSELDDPEVTEARDDERQDDDTRPVDRDDQDVPESGDGGGTDGPDLPSLDLPDDDDDAERPAGEREDNRPARRDDRDGGRTGGGGPGGGGPDGLPRLPGDDDDRTPGGEDDNSPIPATAPPAEPTPEQAPVRQQADPEPTVAAPDSPDEAAAPSRAVTGNEPVKLEDEKFPPTQEQQDLYDTVLAGADTVMQAGAGTGKTSTLEGLARRIAKQDPNRKIGYAAFNKSVQLEAEGRMPGNTESRTGHSLAFQWAPDWMKERSRARGMLRRPDAVAAHLGITSPMSTGDGNKALDPAEIAMAAVRTVDKFATSADDSIDLWHLPERMRELPQAAKEQLLRHADKVWADLKSEKGRLRLTPDHYRKMWALTRPDFSKPGQGFRKPIDVLFVDEAQDTPPVLAKVYDDQSIQKVIVGDADQAIYGFTGAVDYLSTAAADAELPLTKSWRYGPQVAAVGNRFLSLLGSKKRVVGAGPDGQVLEPGTMENADAILVRSNGGMIGEIIREQQAGRLVGVPKGTKQDLQALVDSVAYLQGTGPAPERMHEDLEPFRTWTEVEEEIEKGDDQKLAMLGRIVEKTPPAELGRIVDGLVEMGDKGGLDGVVTATDSRGLFLKKGGYPLHQKLKDAGIGRGLSEFGFRLMDDPSGEKQTRGRNAGQAQKHWAVGGSPEAQEAALDRVREALGSDVRKPDVVVSTAHKAKGLEWDRVRVGDDFRGPKTDPETGEKTMPSREELMLAYVTVTRAKKDLDPGSLAWVYEETDDADGDPEIRDRTPEVAPEPETVSVPAEEVAQDLAEVGAEPLTPEQADEELSPFRQGEMGMMLAPGEQVLTASGRLTTPFPTFKTPVDTDRKTEAAIRKVDDWLIANARAEAESRGMPVWGLPREGDRPTQAEKDTAEAILFDPAWMDMPAKPSSSLKPLTGRDDEEETPSPEVTPEPEPTPVVDDAEGMGKHWVRAGSLQPGDAATIPTGDGEKTGYVADFPIEAEDGEIAVPLSQNPDGSGDIETVYVPRDALAGRVVNGTLADPEGDGAAPSADELEVLQGVMPEQMPVDADGDPIFPGSTIEVDGEPATATAVTPDQVEVNRPNDHGNEPVVRPDQVDVTDPAVPSEGWTEDGAIADATPEPEVAPEAAAPKPKRPRKPKAPKGDLAAPVDEDKPKTVETLERDAKRLADEIDRDQEILDDVDRDNDPDRYDSIEEGLRRRRLQLAEMEADAARQRDEQREPEPEAERDDGALFDLPEQRQPADDPDVDGQGRDAEERAEARAPIVDEALAEEADEARKLLEEYAGRIEKARQTAQAREALRRDMLRTMARGRNARAARLARQFPANKRQGITTKLIVLMARIARALVNAILQLWDAFKGDPSPEDTAAMVQRAVDGQASSADRRRLQRMIASGKVDA